MGSVVRARPRVRVGFPRKPRASGRRDGTFLFMDSTIPSSAGRVREMSFVRPRYLAIAFSAFFGIVAYLAWSVAHASKGPWFEPDVSRTVYQTSMVGGVLVLIGLFVTASIVPYFARPVRSRGISPGPPPRDQPRGNRSGFAFPTAPPRATRNVDPEWALDGLLEDSGVDPSRYMDADRERDAAAVSAALSRLVPREDAVTPGDLMDRLSDIRVRNSGPLVSEDREMTQVLVRLVNEIKPLLVASKQAGLNVPEIRRLVAEATAGREGDLSYRVRLVEQLKDTLEAALFERITEDLQGVLVDIERTKVATQQVHSAELTAAEGVALLDTGNYLAALERATKAREAVTNQIVTIAPRTDWANPASPVALAGPSVVASIYVAIGAMLLPAVTGFLVTNFVLNTTAILFLSYGWFGFVLYSLVSIYTMARPYAPREPRQERKEFSWDEE